MTTGSLQYRLNKTPEEANDIAQQYWKAFPRIQPWINEVIRIATYQKFIRYWSGRIWREEDPVFSYKGANAQIQGGAADLMSIALMRADKILTAQNWGFILSIVHDEALYEIKDECIEIASNVLARVMQVEDIFGFPFSTEVKIGKSYGNLETPEFRIDPTKVEWEYFQEPRIILDFSSIKELAG